MGLHGLLQRWFYLFTAQDVIGNVSKLDILFAARAALNGQQNKLRQKVS
jgi:hypothetical protein